MLTLEVQVRARSKPREVVALEARVKERAHVQCFPLGDGEFVDPAPLEIFVKELASVAHLVINLSHAEPLLAGLLVRQTQRPVCCAIDEAVEVRQNNRDSDVIRALEVLCRLCTRREHGHALLQDRPIRVREAIVLVSVIFRRLGTELDIVHLHSLALLEEPFGHHV
eukprot:scaffold84118_cov46-Tisochrysis_lutea.AAC.1